MHDDGDELNNDGSWVGAAIIFLIIIFLFGLYLVGMWLQT